MFKSMLHFCIFFGLSSVGFVLSHVNALSNAVGFRALLYSLIRALLLYSVEFNGSFVRSRMCSYDLMEYLILPKFHNWVMAFKIHVIAKVRFVHDFLKQTILLTTAGSRNSLLEVAVVKKSMTP